MGTSAGTVENVILSAAKNLALQVLGSLFNNLGPQILFIMIVVGPHFFDYIRFVGIFRKFGFQFIHEVVEFLV